MAYDASYNTVFFRRLGNWAKSYQDIRDEAKRLKDIWTSLSISGDPDFAEEGGVTTSEATALVTMLGDLADFTENQTVSQGDRVAVLAPFLDEE